MVGIETSDDACVLKITDDIAMIQTVDFFTPIADDPYTFGKIAAANALSDVYAMGGEPRLALNIVAFPASLDPEILTEILRGGADKVKEAGCTLAGGHSVEDEEPKYGLCVTGFVHPDKVLKNNEAKVGDVLVLTKQIGTGIINTAIKAEMASKEAEDLSITIMSSLNKNAKNAMMKYDVHSCTDITGFGLLGHGVEMAEGSGVKFELYKDQVNYVEEALEYASMGLVPAGAYDNLMYFEDRVDVEGVDEDFVDMMFDPQTSGGLLISLSEEDAKNMLEDIKTMDFDTEVAIIGKVVKKEENDKFIKIIG